MVMECKVTARKSHYGKEGPWELPEGWEWTTLGTISSYGVCQSVQVEQINDDVWVLELEDIEKDTGKLISEKTKKERVANGTRHSFQSGQVLYSKLRTYLNKVLLAEHDGFCSTEIMPITFYGGIIPEYMVIVLSSPYFLDYAESCGYGVKMPRLGTNDAIRAAIPIPPLEEQKIIVQQVKQWMCSIENLSCIAEDLSGDINKAKIRILDLAIRGKLVPQSPSDEPAIELLKRINPDFVPSHNLHYEDIPQSWTVCRLSDVCVDFIVPQRDKPKIFDGDIPWCRIEDIEGKYLNGSLSGRLVSKKTIQQMNMRICPVGTVICSCSASIGTQAIVTQPCCTNQTFIGLVPDDRFIYNEFLYYFLASQTEQFLDIGTGTTIKYISREKFEEYRIPLPPLVEQRRIVERIEYCFLLLKQIQSATSIC
jgi:type I restriction enzyme S subunit